MPSIHATQIFTPSEYPKHTYINRNDDELEQRLREALETPGEVVSISGPSKSGKTVLVERVVGVDNLITISGAGIKDADHLWDRVLDWIGTPVDETRGKSTSISGTATLVTKAEGGLPLFGKAGVEGSAAVGAGHEVTEAHRSGRRGLVQVAQEIANSSFVLLIDDFHYMDRSVQAEVAKSIKEAARQGIKICTASVPHRADDVVRSNPELRGRVRAVNLTYWKPAELGRIGDLGFPLLNLKVEGSALGLFAAEASGSPQLMQAMCLQCCFELDARTALPTESTVLLSNVQIKNVLEETATRTDFSSLVTKMHNGPKKRGTERKEFFFYDGTVGDVYRCVLLALAFDPPRLSDHYNELFNRIVKVCCGGETPQAASIYQTCSQLSRMADQMYRDQRVLEWDESESILEIVDPYFLFYLRASGKLANMGERRPD